MIVTTIWLKASTKIVLTSLLPCACWATRKEKEEEDRDVNDDFQRGTCWSSVRLTRGEERALQEG